MQVIGRYRVIRPIGHGGMGQVFLAEDPTLERRVALKLLHRDPTRRGLREEGKALAALSHPGIVTIFEIGEHDGCDFIAMEYLPGRTLRQLFDAPLARPSRSELVAICAKVALAVGAAHRAGILHRDIKPENIVVSDTGGVKVVDFGIARRLETNQNPLAVTARDIVTAFSLGDDAGTDTEVSAGTQSVFGTPAYMAPEVLHGGSSTEATDIYSLGVVLHECLAGRRPYPAGSLVEMLAQVIDAPPPPLDDPFGPLVGKMLSRDPAQRPVLADIAATLMLDEPAPAKRRALWPIAALVAIVIVLGVVGWRLATREPETPPPEPVAASIAIAPLSITIPQYGTDLPSEGAAANTLAQLFGEVEGAHLTGVAITAAGDPRAAARALHADYLLSGAITERATTLHAELALQNVATGERAATITLDRPRLAQTLSAVAEAAAQGLAPAAHLDHASSRPRAQKLYQQAEPLIDAIHFRDARLFLEQAVDADPTYADGWYALALVLSWMEAPEEQVAEAAKQAEILAPAGPRHELMRAISLYLAGKFHDARVALEPLDTPTAGAGAPNRREVLYFLGEANWHDGRHKAGFEYFQRALEADKQFRPATIHSSQYAVARGDGRLARYMVGLSGEDFDLVELAVGNYEQLADSSKDTRYKAHALLVLGRPLPEDLAKLAFASDLDRSTYRIALAVEAGDRAAARAEFAAAWARATAAPPTAGTFYGIEFLGEVLVSAELTDETRILVGYLAEHSKSKPKRGYHRLALLAAPILRDSSLLFHADLTERMSRLASAMEAELAGNRGKAAEILGELVADPTSTWDYPERAALLRNLRALHRTKDIAAQCDKLLHPAIFRTAFIVLRGGCTHKRDGDRVAPPGRGAR